MRTLVSLFIYCFAAAHLLQAQTITGILTEANGTPAMYATVQLFRTSDSVHIAGTAADTVGVFSITNVAAGRYYTVARLLGFEDLYSASFDCTPSVQVDLGTLQLKEAAQLATVTVTARRPLIENFADRVVVNIEGSALASGNSVYDLLKRSPGVVITPQDAILLQGKGGTMITIDGRPTQMSGNELAAYLKSIPAETIRSIELITNPSSKYDAQGVAGIINIRLKKNTNIGMSGSFNIGHQQSIHARKNTGLQLNYKAGKINAFGNYSLTNAAQTVSQTIDRTVGTTTFAQKVPKVENWNTHYAKAGADWLINDRNTLGFIAIGSAYNARSVSSNCTQIGMVGVAAMDSVVLGTFNNPENNQRLQLNLNYRFADTLGNEWTIDADRIAFGMDGNNQLQNNFFNNNGFLTQKQGLRSDLSKEVTVWSFKTDIVRNIANGLKVETGAKITHTNSLNEILGERSGSEAIFVADAGRSNTAEFEEQIAAAYVNLSKDLGKWSFQAGTRAEHTDLEGISKDLEGNVLPIRNTTYLDFFPSAYIQYKIGQQGNSFGLSANRRIERPAYQDLNPFVWQIDPYTSERGNPALRPAYIQSVQMKFTYKYAASVSLGYAHTNDAQSTVARMENEQAYTQLENLATQDNVSLNFNITTPIASWWEGYCWIGVWNNRFRSNLPEGRLDNRTWGGGAWIGQQITLPRKLQFEFSSWCQFPTTEGMIRNKGIWSLDLGLKKKIMKERATIKIGVNDVFHTQRWTSVVDFGNVQAVIKNRWESQSVSAQFSWNFGNSKIQARDRKNSTDTENNRIKGGKNG